MMSPHGIPVDLLDRLVIIRTLQYVLEEIIAILNTRAKVSSTNFLLSFCQSPILQPPAASPVRCCHLCVSCVTANALYIGQSAYHAGSELGVQELMHM